MNVPPSRRPYANRSASYIGSITLLGRIAERLGAFAQILLIAGVLGSTVDADLYFIASIVPLMLGGVVGEALYASILPAVVARRDRDATDLLAAGFWLSAIVLASLTSGYLVVVSIVVPVAEPAGSGGLLPWLAFAPVALMFGLATYCAAALLHYERYLWPPFRSAAATIGTVALTGVAFALGGGVIAVGLAMSLGYGLALALLVLELAAIGQLAVFRLPRRAAMRKVLGRWRMFRDSLAGGIIGGQAFVFIERALAAPLGVGAVASISYGRGIAFTPQVLSASIAQGVFPGMLRARAADSMGYVRQQFLSALRLTTFLALSVAAFFALFAGGVTKVVFDRGAVSAGSLEEVEQTLAAFSIGLVGSMIMILAARTLSALDQFRGIVMVQSVALLVYVGTAPFLAPRGVPELALAFGIAELSGALLAIGLIARYLDAKWATVVLRSFGPALARAAGVVALLVLARVALTRTGASSYVAVSVGAAVDASGVGFALLTAPWPELRAVRRHLPAHARGGRRG